MSYSNIPEELRLLPQSVKIAGIYMILNIIDGKCYVGQTFDFRLRQNKHFSDLSLNKHKNRHLQFAWNKYGKDAFEFAIMEVVSDLSKLSIEEQAWIDASNCCNSKFGYNLNPASDSPLGIKRTKETKLRMSEAQRKRGPDTEETKWCKSEAQKNRKDFSEAHRLNMAKAQIGRKHPDEVKAKIALAHKGKIHSEQHRIKNGRAHQRFNKWPHSGGNRCKCDECRKTRSIDSLAAYYRRKKSNG